MTNTKKLLLASGVATALAAASMPSYAIIEGTAGEALLVPFVLYSNPVGDISILPDIDEPSINTIITVTTPSAIGKDTIPNFFTAPSTTPTNPGPPVTEQKDPDLTRVSKNSNAQEDYVEALHLFFFDQKSVEAFNISIPTSADDFSVINWGDMVEKYAPYLRGVKGYVVITNDKETTPGWKWRDAARFTMFGDAFMIWPTNIGLIDTKIPVLPMSDGADEAGVTVPSTPNNVIFNSSGEIIAASPLTSGMRTNLSNGNFVKGDEGDYTLFDLTMSNRFAPTLHVIWVDENIGQRNTAYVYNDVEQDCSMTLPIANELNVYWTSLPTLFPGAKCLINPVTGDPVMQDPEPVDGPACVPGILPALPWLDATLELCYPEGDFKVGLDLLNGDIFYPGFVRFKINEYIDTGKGSPDSAAVAFSIQLQVDVLDEERRNLVNLKVIPTVLPVETALGHERGQFNADE